MQVEFERRVMLMDPNLKQKKKLTSDTIFSFLNAFTKRYVKQIYLLADQTQNNTRAQKVSIDSIKSLITRQVIDKTETINSDTNTDLFKLPDDYFLYIRSNSLVKSTYKNESLDKAESLPNELIDIESAAKIITTPHNHIILRNPQVIMHSSEDQIYLNVIHDNYTEIEQVDLVYYRMPKEFNVLNVDNNKVLDRCELPESMHIEIVEGAVEMFVTEAKYRLNLKQNEQ